MYGLNPIYYEAISYGPFDATTTLPCVLLPLTHDRVQSHLSVPAGTARPE